MLAPVVRGRKGEHVKELESARRSGFVRVRCDGILYDLSEPIKLAKNSKHTIEIVVDRLVIQPSIRSRLADSLETAASLTGGICVVSVQDGEDYTFSQNYACPEHGASIEELTPRMFSFNNPYGACPKCTGLGVFMKIDPDRVIPDKSKSINGGGLKGAGWAMEGNSVAAMYLNALSEKYNFSLDTPLGELPDRILDILLYGTKGEKLRLHRETRRTDRVFEAPFEGIVNNLDRRFRETQSSWIKEEIESFMSAIPCERVPRQAALPHEPGGDGGRKEHCRAVRSLRCEGDRVPGQPEAHGKRDADRQNGAQGDQEQAQLPAQRRVSNTSRSRALQGRFPAAKASASGWPRRSAPPSWRAVYP